MSNATLSYTMWRIEVATKYSPLAVFKSKKPGCLDSMFASTVETQKAIFENHPDLIGVFDNSMNLKGVKAQLSQHLSELV